MATLMTQEQVRMFHEQGFVRPGIKVPDNPFDKVKEVCGKIVSDNVGKPDIIRQVHMPKRAGYPQDEGNDYGTAIFEYCLSPAILDPVEQVLGPDIILFTSIMFAKPPGVGKEVPWHQDGHYTPIQPLDALTVWIAIEDVDKGNGCIKFIPGSNKLGIVPHFAENRKNISTTHSIDREYFDPDTAVDNILQSGEFSIHGEHTIHGSNPNTSGRRRTGLAFRYMSASSLYNRGAEERGGNEARAAAVTTRWPIWVVRGQNRHPGNDLKIGHEGLEHYDDLAADAVRRASERVA